MINLLTLSKRLKIVNIELRMLISLRYIKKGLALGTFTICENGKHIIYLDYDNFKFEWMQDEIKYLQKKYKLSHFYIFQSSVKKNRGNYHAICFDKINAKLYRQIIEESNADALFKLKDKFSTKNVRVLRFTNKTNGKINCPEFKCFLSSKHYRWKKSLAHINFYSSIFKFHIDKNNHDNSKKLNVCSYETMNV